MTKSNETKSLPKVKRIHGVEIEKKPCGKYFEALQTCLLYTSPSPRDRG